MKAALLYGARDLRVENFPDPAPKDGEALIRITATGVCGSDLHFFQDGRIGDAVVTEPHILGHEYTGVVIDAARVKGLKNGDVVAVEPGIACWNCESCLTGRYNLCRQMRFTGSPPFHGSFCEYIAIPERNLVKLEPGMTPAQAAMIEPLAVGMHAVAMTNVRPGQTIATIGLGPVGLFAKAAAQVAGAMDYYGSDLVPERLDKAMEYGYTKVFRTGQDDVVQGILDATNGRGVDVVFECAGEPDTLQTCIDVAAYGGTVGYIGICPKLVTCDYSLARRKELTIQNIRRYKGNYAQCIALISRGIVNVDPLITHHFKLEQINTAFDLVEYKKDGVIKAVIEG